MTGIEHLAVLDPNRVPIGLSCIAAAGVRKGLTVQGAFKGATPFFFAEAINIALLVARTGLRGRVKQQP